MKTNKLILFFLVSGLLFLFTCKKVEREMMVETGEAENITDVSADITGTIKDFGTGAVKCGHCYSTRENPTIYFYGDTGGITELDISDNITFTSSLTGLISGTEYHIVGYIRNNNNDVVYGEYKSFITKLKDKNYNTYNVIRIGTQLWMKEDLKVTVYRDSSEILLKTVPTEWSSLSAGGYCLYNNESTYKDYWGTLYNWYAASSSSKLCPKGWHVPTKDDWETLSSYLTTNGFGYQGSGNDIAKSMSAGSAGNSPWTQCDTAGMPGNDQGSNNSSGFTGRPHGKRNAVGQFLDFGSNGFWWSSSEFNTTDSWFFSIHNNVDSVIIKNSGNKGGLSVRCVKDNP
jgi:uncharacterized protein (TIGR02145 family)